MTGNYILAGICFFWAMIALVSRGAMFVMKERWKKWELENAYTEQRPAWLSWVIAFGVILIALTWFAWLYFSVSYGWIIAVLVSITLVKLGSFIFSYGKFRSFVSHMLNSPGKMAALNIGVLVLASGLIALGVFVYLP